MNKEEYQKATESYSLHVWKNVIIPFARKHKLSHVLSNMSCLQFKKNGKWVSSNKEDELADELESLLYEYMNDTPINHSSWLVNGIDDETIKELLRAQEEQ